MNFSHSSKEISLWVNICKNSIIWPATPFMTWPPKKEKIDRFLGGLNPQLPCTLSMFDFPNFQTLVNKAFIAEREHKLVSDNRPANNDHKRKFEPRKEGKPVQKARTWQHTQVEYKPN